MAVHSISMLPTTPSYIPLTRLDLLPVSWNWGSGAPGGTVAETKDHGEISIQSKRGNTIKKSADGPDNPAVHIERSGNDVVKKASELNVESKASGGSSKKHDRDDDNDDDAAEEPITENADGKDVKKAKTETKSKKTEGKKNTAAKTETKKEEKKEEKKETNGDKDKKEAEPKEKKKAGRPKGTGSGAGGEKKKKDAKPRATEGIGSRTRSRA